MQLLSLFKEPAKPVYDFYPLCGDTPEIFNKNLKTMSEDWHWRTTPVSYQVNEQGYRAPNWNQVDWDNSVLVFGCSFVFGTGIDGLHTVATQLSLLLEIPVVNLGIPGTSPVFHWMNTGRLIDHGVNPKAVIYMWPHHARTLDFPEQNKNNLVINCGSWLTNVLSKVWCTNETMSIEFLRTSVQATSKMWNCPVLHYSVNDDTVLALPNIKKLQWLQGDYARDEGAHLIKRWNGHPGILTNKLWANIIEDDLKISMQ